MEEIFLSLLNRSIAAGWLILAVVVLRVLLKKAPKLVRCVLWGFVAFRLVCPFSFESVLSLIPSAQTVNPGIVNTQSPLTNSGIPLLNSLVNPALSEALPPQSGVEAGPMLSGARIAAAIWVAGAAAMLVYVAISYLRLRKKVAAAMRVEKNLWICDEVASPFILGVFRPRVYLPSAMGEEALSYVIAHENAHLKRHDHWWKPLGVIVLSVYWFSPLCWLAYGLFCKDIELACDERVVKELSIEHKKAYAQALLFCGVSRKRIAACPLAFGEVGVKERVKSVLRYQKPAFWVIAAAALACIVTAVCLLTNPVDTPKAADGLFSRGYTVESVEYAAPQYSFVMTADKAPRYFLTKDRMLVTKGGALSPEESAFGPAQKVTLTKENFDRGFEQNGTGGEGWENTSAARLREGNQNAWHITAPREADDGFYYLLRQKNGDIYLTYDFRWVFKLRETSDEDAGASGFPKEAYTAFSYTDSVDFIAPTIYLSRTDDSFQFTYSLFSSTILAGTYELTDTGLTLTAGDDRYVFHRDGGGYLFDAEKSSKIPEYKYSAGAQPQCPVPNGARFSPAEPLS